jgi:SET domain-containing protein
MNINNPNYIIEKYIDIKDFDLSHLYLDKSNIIGAGRGVFTKINIPKDTDVEKACIIKIPKKNLENTTLNDYVFINPYNKKEYFIAFGYGSMYNHSDNPNIHYYYDKDENIIIYESLRDIKAGEELYISYGASWWKTRNLEKN